MKYAGIMSSFHAGHRLTENRHRALNVERAFAPQELIKTFTVDVFHHQEKDALGTLAEIRHVNYVGMPDRCCGAHFAFEACNRLSFLQHLIAENVGTNSLDSDASSYQVLIARQVNLSHRASSQALLQQITRRQQRWAGQGVLRFCLIQRTEIYFVFITVFTTRALAHELKPKSKVQSLSSYQTLNFGPWTLDSLVK